MKTFLRLAIVVMAMFSWTAADAQSGCTASEACNFDPFAEIDDGSCIWSLDCAGNCGGTFVVDDCGNCFDPNISGELQFQFNGSIEYWVVPQNVSSITIEAFGGQGGSGVSGTGGLGARILSTVNVTSGETLSILVGGQGQSQSTRPAGGGGSFIVNSGNSPLVVAGGGGAVISAPNGNEHGRITESGANGFSPCCPNNYGLGGTNGNGGTNFSDGPCAGNGGGFLSDGQISNCIGANARGRGFLNGGAGGVGGCGSELGGFGGGGGGGCDGAGGGGGYSGGGASYSNNGYGGGGGSFAASTMDIAESGVRSGNGLVIISYTSTPLCVPGCTDPEADQFNPIANYNDGSCTYDLGCLDPTACNYSAIATIDDGSCQFVIDCAGVCGGANVLDACGNCYDQSVSDEVSFTYTGSLQSWTVPAGVSLITIEVLGAQGGGGGYNSLAGGLGARMKGTFSVNAGEAFNILVGEKGQTGADSFDPHGHENGGGGGSFVVRNDNTPYIIAGGGGGGPSSQYGFACSRDVELAHGQITENGATISCAATGNGGSGGNGGSTGGNQQGGAGGGFFGNGDNGGTHCCTSNGGLSYLNGSTGGSGNCCYGSNNRGGYGGGGGGQLGGPGGGGGYSGGGTAANWDFFGTYGGGGGSYNLGTNQDNLAGVQEGNGLVTITYNLAPECIPGCTDPVACNYNADADIEDNSCFYPDGCIDPIACNFDPNANCDNGTCTYPGCTDNAACNFDPNAACDNGSCILTFDCAGICGGPYVLDACGNCYDQNATVEASFTYTGSLQNWTVPAGITEITIEVFGAQGGGGGYNSLAGGLGARMKGTFSVNAGETFDILVGEKGQTGADSYDPHGNENGGGGGSFVVLNGPNTPYIIAGGGGGGPSTQYGLACSRDVELAHGQISENGASASCYSTGNGGTGGNGGSTGGWLQGGAGGGFFDSGANGGTNCCTAFGGQSYNNGGTGGSGECCNSNNTRGGYGGGGGGQLSGPGGGGGYSGGGTFGDWSSYSTYGGGGGSYNIGTSQDNIAGVQEGNGLVIISYDLTPDCVPGCTDPLADNFVPGANLDDGSCRYDLGCTDVAACNYDPTANEDNGTCAYIIDCTGTCGGSFAEDDCGNCFDPALTGQETFTFSGAIQNWSVPAGVSEVTIEVFGAQGGGGGGFNSLPGGRGARMKGTFGVSAGQSLDILVGEKGGTGATNWDPHGNENGGGGGSFVVLNGANTPLIIAGGGGGGPATQYGNNCSRDIAIAHGQVTENGADTPWCDGIGSGGTAGGGGTRTGSLSGGAGGGFSGNGQNGEAHCSTPFGGRSYLSGGAGGDASSCYSGNAPRGGFGGGGAGEIGSPGGGGGYSGGGAAGSWSSFSTYGGGGGSLNTGTNQDNQSGARQGDGLVVITYSLAPDCQFGCTDPTADNYNLAATNDDGTCRYDLGCLDTNACNFDPTAAEDDGSCLYLDCAGVCGGIFTLDACGNCYDANAVSDISFAFSGNIETWTVPADGNYYIEAAGAEGGTVNASNVGGRGAIMKGDFFLTAGTQVYILVGQQGFAPNNTEFDGGGGGGGSFVAFGPNYQSSTPLIVAGGGGGGTAWYQNVNQPGEGGQTTNNGPFGGDSGDYCDNGGAGFSGNSTCSGNATSFTNGGQGGNSTENGDGGFGGGGAAIYHPGGGGGGYTGGRGGYNFSTTARGGGSYNDGINQDNLADANNGNGYVTIAYNDFPECLPGCLDPAACNYNIDADIEDNSCFYPDGCIDPIACNFDPNANCDNGTCTYPGCTDNAACNFDPNAACDNGSCIFIVDCAGICGGPYVLDACGNCYDQTATDQVSFAYTGSLQNWTVPVGIIEITIEVFGAQGGGGGYNSLAGGLGARMKGTFAVNPGETFDILVGEKGQTGADSFDPNGNENGGGGGSFVVLNGANTPYIIAGGGGGGPSTQYGLACSRDIELAHGQITENGASASCYATGNGGNSGNGGSTYGWLQGGAGGGFQGSGANGSANCCTPTGGIAYLNGGAGGNGECCNSNNTRGGYGGGGGGGFSGPGGGGGYSGGGTFGDWSSYSTYGGGGGSYNIGNNQDNIAGLHEGNGLVIISYDLAPVCIPGCTDPVACNYNANADIEDNSCFYPDGCNDPIACNFDPNANCDNGTCTYPGCTDNAACNFDPNAACENGSCIFVVDCAGFCGGTNVIDACGNCYDQAATDQVSFTYTGSLQNWTVPAGITEITIEAFGAQGGGGGYNSLAGGLGARMKGTFSVNPGETFDILVGEKGQTGADSFDPHGNENGGGGGSFVVLNGANTPYIIAGGGGGGPSTQYGLACSRDIQLAHGQITENGASASCYATGNGGNNGNGGSTFGYLQGGAGGGFQGNGANGNANCCNIFGGQAYLNGGAGGNGECCHSNNTRGGYGGGGGAGYGGPGGGGGYSGGGTFGEWSSYSAYGGGGGSYNIGNSQDNIAGLHEGSGLVVITYSLAPDCQLGCTDPAADNYNPAATNDDGTCRYDLGCLDTNACNFDPTAAEDDGSCLYLDCAGVCGGTFALDACGNCYDQSAFDAVSFTYTGTLQNWTVPAGVSTITIEVLGAQGGGGGYNSLVGGLGARMKGTFSVNAGETFDILVGEKGQTGADSFDPHGNENGGGGGSFVVLNGANTPYIIAGGGGGGPSNQYGFGCSDDVELAHGQITENGATISCAGTGNGGNNGNGGSTGGDLQGGGGGGFAGNGSNGGSHCCTSFGGASYLNGAAGGSGNCCYGSNNYGGYGGGGGGQLGGPGGGGGYSGGGTSANWDFFGTYGGGGGSYNIGTNQDNASGVQQGNGLVIISYDLAPECIPGCTDPMACNFNANADIEDNSCFYPDGCNDPVACNFDPNALCDNGTCTYPGCIDNAACNFDPNAACDDGSCIFIVDCAGICGGPYILDDCQNCFNPADLVGTFEFSYSGGMQQWTVPEGITEITIEVRGAQGGGGGYNSLAGGLGARITGTFTVTPGETFDILVGEKGQTGADSYDPHGNENGGGGGSFVVLNGANTPYIIAGGGGGGPSTQYGLACSRDIELAHGQITENGASASCYSTGNGGNDGNGGSTGGYLQGGAGAGFFSDGANGGWNCCLAGGGQSYINGAAGGNGECCNSNNTRGGYGGGGGGQLSGPGGGGGYSGGGTFGDWSSYSTYGGGGGSYNIGTSQDNIAGLQEGNGLVTISYQETPLCTPGCDDVTASNYDPEVTFNNGSCIYLGCTDPTACNFDSDANSDDGSCIYVFDCAGVCGGTSIVDDCGTCYDPTLVGDAFTFSYTGSIQTFVVPDGFDQIYVEVFGASGGSWNGEVGGLGAKVSGMLDVQTGQEVKLLVGAAGQNGDGQFRYAGGGGGSFVTDNADNPILIAGGGGGVSGGPTNANMHASASESGNNGFSPNGLLFFGVGGTAGNGATNAASGEACGGNGGGFFTNGEEALCAIQGTPTSGLAFLNGANGGVAACGGGIAGGFGGGGGGGCHGGGGGGGYSGGGGSYGIGGNGGGGGSFNAALDAVSIAQANSGNGYIVITLQPAAPDCELGCTDPLASNYSDQATTDNGTCIYLGCTDPNAANYDPQASTDDGSCIYLGCTDPIAANYDAQANTDDGSCIYLGCIDPLADNYDPQANTDDGSCIYLGCTDAFAANYDPQANTDDGSCIYLGCIDPIAANFDPQANTDDGSCIFLGCIDPLADNYDPQANTDDGSCTYLGCTDAIAANFDPQANTDDGSCIYLGCTDPLAANYDPQANSDDGSCIYAGCTNPSADNFDPQAGIDDGSCVISGCTNPIALNYNPIANLDNGSCQIAGCTYPAASNYNMIANIDDGSCSFVSPPAPQGCTDVTACNFNSLAEVEDGSCEFDSCAACTDASACNFNPLATLDNGSCEFISCAGCTDASACNYNANATIDDASCEFMSCAGCTDANACNYNPNATIVDDSCDYGCIGCTYATANNFNANATIDDGSCTFGASEISCGFGTFWDPVTETCVAFTDCPADLNGDGIVNSADLLAFLGAFGTLCN